MTTLENITAQMNNLEIVIARQQAYLLKHEEANNAGEFDEQWEQYKEEAQYNLDKWDAMKRMRDEIKA
jgi:3-phenylpropionate/cinnamic acid dioxygenase small subunit